jgi:hypothetical protein
MTCRYGGDAGVKASGICFRRGGKERRLSACLLIASIMHKRIGHDRIGLSSGGEKAGAMKSAGLISKKWLFRSRSFCIEAQRIK